jgi:hypothetical protein
MTEKWHCNRNGCSTGCPAPREAISSAPALLRELQRALSPLHAAGTLSSRGPLLIYLTLKIANHDGGGCAPRSGAAA